MKCVCSLLYSNTKHQQSHLAITASKTTGAETPLKHTIVLYVLTNQQLILDKEEGRLLCAKPVLFLGSYSELLRRAPNKDNYEQSSCSRSILPTVMICVAWRGFSLLALGRALNVIQTSMWPSVLWLYSPWRSSLAPVSMRRTNHQSRRTEC